MNLQQMRYLVALEEMGSISRAARKLNVSQPAMSQALHNLEVELGVELMRRDGRKTVLTEAGSAAFAAASRVMAAVGEVRNAVEHYRSTQILRIAVTHGTGPLLSGYLAEAARRDRGMQYRLVDVAGDNLYSCLLDGRADLGFGDISNMSAPFETVPVGAVELALASPSGTNLPPVVRMGHLDGLAFITVLPSAERAEVFDSLFRSAQVNPRIVIETDDQLGLIAMVRAGIGSTLAWKYVLDGLSGLEDMEVRTFDPPQLRPTGFIYINNTGSHVKRFVAGFRNAG